MYTTIHPQGTGDFLTAQAIATACRRAAQNAKLQREVSIQVSQHPPAHVQIASPFIGGILEQAADLLGGKNPSAQKLVKEAPLKMTPRKLLDRKA